MAAELIEAGVDVHEIYRRVYEGVPYGKLALLARGLANVERYDDGRLTHDRAERERLHATQAPRRATPRASSTTSAPSRARPSPRWSATGSGDGQAGLRKVSLRASDDRVDVSPIARAQGGGGHRQAAGFTTELSRRRAGQLPARAARRPAVGDPRTRLPASPSALSPITARRAVACGLRPALRQARRHHLARRGRPASAGGCRADEGRPRRARSTRSPPACCWCWSAAPPGCSGS